MTAVAILVRRFLGDYRRNGVNLVMLIVVPVAFVIVAAGSLADAAQLLGGASGGLAVETATAGWAAAFLAGVAMYFQISGAREVDRRLVIAGLPTSRLVTARLLTGLLLAVVASAAALAALELRTGIDAPARVTAGTLMFAVVYLAIGAVVGATVRNPVNGTVLILFVWILDVFLGPTMTSQSANAATRLLPTHYVTLWMADLPLRHGGRLGDLGWAVIWTLGAAVVAFGVVATSTRSGRRGRRRRAPGSASDQVAAASAMGIRDWRRNPALWLLLGAVPAVFILLADAVTPHGSTALVLNQGGRRVTQMLDPADIHAGTMAPVAVASLAALAGLFLTLDSRPADRRLALAGMRTVPLLVARLTVVALAALLAAAASIGVTALVFDADQWMIYALANALVALTYAMLGVLLGPLFGRVSGVFIAFLIPFLDVAIAQSPMLRGEPAGWAHLLPGYGASRVLVDAGLTGGFDEVGALVIALAWLTALTVAAAVVLRPAPGGRRRQRTVTDRGAQRPHPGQGLESEARETVERQPVGS
jgi:ABC-2 family transporter protein